MSKAVHESKGSYTTCGRLSHACLTTSDVSEVTCLYCKSGGIGPYRAKLAYITATDGTAPVEPVIKLNTTIDHSIGSTTKAIIGTASVVEKEYFKCPECGTEIGYGLNEVTKKAFEKSKLFTQEPKAEDQHLLWDTALTDAIETESGTIKPYTAMLRYLSEHFTISRK